MSTFSVSKVVLFVVESPHVQSETVSIHYFVRE